VVWCKLRSGFVGSAMVRFSIGWVRFSWVVLGVTWAGYDLLRLGAVRLGQVSLGEVLYGKVRQAP